LDRLVEVVCCNEFHVLLTPAADKYLGGEHGRTDRLTDRIGLGVLTRLVHRDLVDEVLAETGRTEQRRRLLPARVVVYLVLAITLFFDDAYEEVMRKLVEACGSCGPGTRTGRCLRPRRCARPVPAWVLSRCASSTHGWPGRWPVRAPPAPGWAICG
jgi:Insertion element 4 transposase N-terminal